MIRMHEREDDQAQNHAEQPGRCADHPEQREQDDQEHERGAEVVAEHDEHGQHGGPRQQRDQQRPPVCELPELLPARQQVRAPYEQRELRELRRLELDRRPPGSSVPRRTRSYRRPGRGSGLRWPRAAAGRPRTCSSRGGIRASSHMMASPTTAPASCLAKTLYGEAPLSSWDADEVDRTITSPTASSSAGRPQDEVVRRQRPVKRCERGCGARPEPSRAHRAAASRLTASANASPRAG